MTDARLKSTGRDSDESREARGQNDPRVQDNMARSPTPLSARERWQNNVLPTPPQIPGYRTIWLSTTNQQDSIARRTQLGYQPVKPEDVPGFELATLKTGDYAGMIGINEMLLFKLPEELWQVYMEELHHTAPQENIEALRYTAEQFQETVLSNGGKAFIGSGTLELGKHSARPDFS
ncbi:MAG: hypothetical protein IOB84_10415 [Brevundimonas sp.]|jgi:hypothetical protein|nr:hypothetical protein [Brevundimonas sp.]